MPAQDRLLRATEYGEITRIGASRPINVDVRIVAATNENLPAQVDKGKFRADLLDRLGFEVITLPPLRARSGRHPASRGAFRPAHGGRARVDQLARFHAARRGGDGGYCGPATFASCATWSSARVSPRGSGAGDRRDHFDPFHSPWAPVSSGTAQRLAPLAEGRRSGVSSTRLVAGRRLRQTTSAPPSWITNGSSSRTRFAATASTSEPLRPR